MRLEVALRPGQHPSELCTQYSVDNRAAASVCAAQALLCQINQEVAGAS